ncbi:MAG: hypothetical protein HY401_08105 [Elusimicrobia bacterium]|nr:hypothetical protein [Elusimicrobiota bacterium]
MAKKSGSQGRAGKASIEGLVTKADLRKALAENTNIVITELSRDMKNAAGSLTNEIKALREDIKPRLHILESNQDNHEARIKKLETVSN